MKQTETKEEIRLPEGCLCSGNCAGPNECIYWEPYDRDYNGRQHCRYYDKYFYPHERGGCLSKED